MNPFKILPHGHPHPEPGHVGSRESRDALQGEYAGSRGDPSTGTPHRGDTAKHRQEEPGAHNGTSDSPRTVTGCTRGHPGEQPGAKDDRRYLVTQKKIQMYQRKQANNIIMLSRKQESQTLAV